VLGSLLVAVAKIATQEKLEGYRVVINDGESAGQSVFHLHAHILGGRPLAWCVVLFVCLFGGRGGGASFFFFWLKIDRSIDDGLMPSSSFFFKYTFRPPG